MFSIFLNTSDLTKDTFLILFNSYNSVTHESQHFNKNKFFKRRYNKMTLFVNLFKSVLRTGIKSFMRLKPAYPKHS